MLPLDLPHVFLPVLRSRYPLSQDTPQPRPPNSQGPTHTSQSTAKIKEMSFTGRLTASKMMASVRTPPAGMPAAPTLDAVAVTLGREEK